MTTIAIRDGVVAYDTRATINDVMCPDEVDKAWISARHKVIFFGAGDGANVRAMVQALEKRRALPWARASRWKADDLPPLNGSPFGALSRGGRLYMIEDFGWTESTGRFWAFGTGAPAALGAMHMGASARRAVEIAIRCDPHSGAPVRILRLAEIV